MDLKRDIYRKLVAWKEKDTGTILLLEGACRAGKTFILNKFAREHYQRCIYINLVALSGEQYLLCLNKALEEQADKPLHRSLELLEAGFINDENTLIIFDEYQYSTMIIEHLSLCFNDVRSHIVIASSYPVTVSDKNHILFSDKVEQLFMSTLSFAEFLAATDNYSLDEARITENRESYYEIYCRIGGYPAVVKTYLETQDIEKCIEELSVIIKNFIQESAAHFDDIIEKQLLEQIYSAIACSMVKYEDGFSVLFESLCNDPGSRYSKESVIKAIKWLQRSNIIHIYKKTKAKDVGDPLTEYRFCFQDAGVGTYFLYQAGVKQTERRRCQDYFKSGCDGYFER